MKCPFKSPNQPRSSVLGTFKFSILTVIGSSTYTVMTTLSVGGSTYPQGRRMRDVQFTTTKQLQTFPSAIDSASRASRASKQQPKASNYPIAYEPHASMVSSKPNGGRSHGSVSVYAWGHARYGRLGLTDVSNLPRDADDEYEVSFGSLSNYLSVYEISRLQHICT